MIPIMLGVLILLPILGFLANGSIAFFGRRSDGGSATTARHPLVTVIGPGVILAAFGVAVALFLDMQGAPEQALHIVRYGQWMPVGNLVIHWSLQLDQLSILMVLVITGVGSLIHLFSVGYMRDDASYARYFAYLNLFVAFMLVLVLGASYPVLFVGWEGVGLASYLLIGFWFSDKANAEAGKKAFVVNRVGDFGFLVAMFLIWVTTQQLDFIGAHAALGAMAGTPVVLAIALFLFIGCAGKSAQLPLYIWLPDAMAGPTPVSALIHAATMVTAGVYLVARAAPIFSGAPEASLVITAVGALTALFAATIALRQWDIKKVLAYSTVSQLGYMFVGVGSGAYTAGVFHLVTHAFFKALLFLGAGSVMHSMGGVIDMRRFGGLRRIMPITAATFLVGSLALAGVAPFAGFFSKDEILATLHSKGWPSAHAEHHDAAPAAAGHASLEGHGQTVASLASSMAANSRTGRPTARPAALQSTGVTADGGGTLDRPGTWQILFWMALVTAGLTAFYTFRAVFMTFTGPTRVPDEAGHHAHESPPMMTLPTVPSALIGWWLFSTNWLAHFLSATPSFTAPSVAKTAVPHVFHMDLAIQGSLAAAIGIVIAAIGHLGRRSDAPQMERFLGPLQTIFANKFYFDQIYAALVVRPLEALAMLAALIDRYLIDGTVNVVARIPAFFGGWARQLQSGLLQRYALAGVLGTLLIVLALASRLR